MRDEKLRAERLEALRAAVQTVGSEATDAAWHEAVDVMEQWSTGRPTVVTPLMREKALERAAWCLADYHNVDPDMMRAALEEAARELGEKGQGRAD